MFQFSAFATRDLWIQSRSVRESRDHHLFDGYPGLIAVFRALQSLLTPSHPPCALCSLTTRIECSRSRMTSGLRRQSSRFNYGPSTSSVLDMPWIIAGKRRPHPGSNVFLAACSAIAILTEASKTIASRLSLGRTLPGVRLRTDPFGILSRCQLPRPNCQRTKQADDITRSDERTARTCMGRGSTDPGKAKAIRLPKQTSTHERSRHEPSSGNRSEKRIGRKTSEKLADVRRARITVAIGHENYAAACFRGYNRGMSARSTGAHSASHSCCAACGGLAVARPAVPVGRGPCVQMETGDGAAVRGHRPAGPYQ